MPSKNWLIRTKSNQILGPVSKEKVLELYQQGTVRPDDEICSGNGYWFYLREKDQVEAFLLGDKRQPFNPMSEAIDVLTVSPGKPQGKAEEEDITLVGGIDLSSLNKTSAESTSGSIQLKATKVEAKISKLATAAQVDAPFGESISEKKKETITEIPPKIIEAPAPVIPGKKLSKKPAPPTREQAQPLKPRKIGDQVVMIGLVLILLALAGMLYYRKRIFSYQLGWDLLPAAYAQTSDEQLKKKSL